MTVLDPALAAGDAVRVTGDQERPDPEVPERARRRTFTAAYKQEILAAYEAAPDGEKGAILRRRWRRPDSHRASHCGASSVTSSPRCPRDSPQKAEWDMAARA